MELITFRPHTTTWILCGNKTGFFPVFLRGFFGFSFETVCFGCLIEPKQTEDPPKQFKSIFGYFSENLGLFRFISFCYETVLFVSVVSI
jgi:hypothetical protein